MADSKQSSPEDSTLIKPLEDLGSTEEPVRGTESYPLLEIAQGPKQGTWYTVAYQKEITLGRAATNSIILEDNSVSRTHSVLQASDGGFTVRDIGSRNGTFVNGKKIKGEVPLNHGDTLKIGIYSLRYLQEADQALTEAPEEATPTVEEETTGTQSLDSPEAEAEETGISAAEEGAAAEAEPIEAEAEIGEKTPSEDLGEMLVPSEVPSPDVTRPPSRSLKNISMLIAVLMVLGAAGYTVYRLGVLQKIKNYFVSEKVPEEKKLEEAKVLKPEPPKAPLGEVVPIILEADATLPGKVFYKGEELGQTPFRISLQVPAGKLQELSAEFSLEKINEKITAKESFQVEKKDDLVTVQFKPKFGKLKIQALPKDGDLYLEGKYEGSEGPAKAIKLENISFDTPVHVPHGEYVAEIRVPQALEGSTSKVKAIRYRREFQISEESPEFNINATDEGIQYFPAEITSNPSAAELFVDGKKLGETPYQGPIPTGRHKLVLKKEGFDDFEKELSIELNTPYSANFNLQTSPAGEFINRGRELLKKGLSNEAIEQLAEALKRNPEPTELSQIHMLLGEAFIHSKTYDQALAYYQKAQGNPAYDKAAQLGVAQAYAGLGQKDQALIQILDVFLNTKDPKIKSQAESVYKEVSPMKSILYIATDPPGAQVSVNGNPIAQPTPVILSDLLVGSYRVGITKAGFKAYETRVSLPISAIKPVIVKLDAE